MPQEAMEKTIIFTGTGGQGIQLAAKVFALGSTLEGKWATLAGEYGGAMRGGHSMANVSVGGRDMRALPVVWGADYAYVMHATRWDKVQPRLSPDAVAVVNVDLFQDDDMSLFEGLSVVGVHASRLASEEASPMSASIALVGAMVTVMGVPALHSLEAALRELIPPYRQQHLEANIRVLRSGASSIEKTASPH